MKPKLAIGLVLILAFTLTSLACGTSGADVREVDVEISEDGTIELPSGGRVIPPEGARIDTTSVSLWTSTKPPFEFEGADSIGSAYLIDFGSVDLPDEVTLEIPYDPGDLPEGTAEGEVFAAYYDEGAEEWVPVAGRVDQDRNVIVVTTDHLSWWNPFTWNWEAWVAVADNILSLRITEMAGAITLLTRDCLSSSEHASVDTSESNSVIQGCIEGENLMVRNIKSFHVWMSGPTLDNPSGDGEVVAPGSSMIARPDRAFPPHTVYAEMNDDALWLFLVDTVARLLPGAGLLPEEALRFIAEGLQRTLVARELSEAVPDDPARSAELLYELVPARNS